MAEWLKRTQGRALEENSARGALHGVSTCMCARSYAVADQSVLRARTLVHFHTSISRQLPDFCLTGTQKEEPSGLHTRDELKTIAKVTPQHGLAKLKQDLAELEDYIPWNAVVPSWSGRRGAWARKTRDCKDTLLVARQLSILEEAIVSFAFDREWRGNSHAEWHDELMKETNPSQAAAERKRMSLPFLA